MTLPERLLAIHHALDSGEVPHAFGGAIALAYWTRNPRGTSDIDVNVFVAAERCEAALAKLPDEIGYTDREIETIVRDGQIRLWWETTPIDLFFDSVELHGEAARHRRLVPFEGVEIPVLGPVELATFKAMFDRTRDWADIEEMLAARTLDADAVRDQLRRLVGPGDTRVSKLDDTLRRLG